MVSIANSLGIGSGVDTEALIAALVNADRQPRSDALDARERKVTARISGMAQVSSAMDALVSAMASRTRNGALGPLPASSDSSVLTARSLAGATRTLQPTRIEVNALATGQSLVAAALPDAVGPIGAGTLTITLGTLTPDGAGDFGFAGAAAGVDIAVGADTSLSGLARAINASAAGVRASVIDDGIGARLVLKGPTGAKSAFIVTASGDPGLDRFVHRPGQSAMTVAGSAADARLTIDGVAVTRGSNTVTDLVAGVGLELVRTGSVALTASRDTGGLAAAVGDLVDAVNALHSLTAELTRSGHDAGALAGDATLRQLSRQLASLTASGSNGLASLGVSTQRNGSLRLDNGRLSAALAADPDGAEALLAGLTASGGALSRARGTLPSGTDSRQAREQASITSARSRLVTSSSTLREQLTKQYGAMERAVNGFRSTREFLTQQVDAWNNSNN